MILNRDPVSSPQAATKQYVDGKVLKFYTGKYNGTDSYGKNNPKSITFPFKPILFIGPHSYDVKRSTVIFCDEIPADNYATSYWFENAQVGMKKSADGKTIYWFGNSPSSQCNVSGSVYYYAAIA